MNNIDIIQESIETYTVKLINNMFGISSIPAQSFIRYGIKNVMKKYRPWIEFFTDESGDIDAPLLLNAVKEEIKIRDGFQIWKIKFTESDITEIQEIYKKIKEENN